jgi:hypothetical protein
MKNGVRSIICCVSIGMLVTLGGCNWCKCNQKSTDTAATSEPQPSTAPTTPAVKIAPHAPKPVTVEPTQQHPIVVSTPPPVVHTPVVNQAPKIVPPAPKPITTPKIASAKATPAPVKIQAPKLAPEPKITTVPKITMPAVKVAPPAPKVSLPAPIAPKI